MVIKFIFPDDSYQVLRPSADFVNFIEIKIDYKNKKSKRVLSLKERISYIASDIGAIDFSIED